MCKLILTPLCRIHSRAPVQVLEIENGLGIGAEDHDLMRKRLEDQGVQDIASVSLHEQ